MTKQELGKQIESLRKECGVSTYELEKKGIHPSLPGTIEKGKKGYTVDSLIKYLDAIDEDLVLSVGKNLNRNKMKKEIYVVVAYRWGYRENHSYTLGVFDDKNEAIKCAERHAEHRGGKYACAVEKCVMNEFENDADYYTNEVYRAKSAMCSASHKI